MKFNGKKKEAVKPDYKEHIIRDEKEKPQAKAQSPREEAEGTKVKKLKKSLRKKLEKGETKPVTSEADRNFKRFFGVEIGVVALLLCVTVLLQILSMGKKEEPQVETNFGNTKTTLEVAFGELFGIKRENMQLEVKPRPEENLELPFKETKLALALEFIDKYNTYINCVQYIASNDENTPYEVVKSEYAVRQGEMYIHLEKSGVPLYFLSNESGIVGLDFEENTYTILNPTPYKTEELIHLDGFDFCNGIGTDTFMGTELYYEAYVLNSAVGSEWIRYYFHPTEEGDIPKLAGYERYSNQGGKDELVEITVHQQFGGDIPEEASVFFDIPAGFTRYTDIVDWEDLVGEIY